MSPAVLFTESDRPAHRFAARLQEGKSMSHSMSASMQRPLSATSRQQQEQVQFRIILAATYPFFLAAAALQRIQPAKSAAVGGRRSVFGEAMAMAASAIPFAFMG